MIKYNQLLISKKVNRFVHDYSIYVDGLVCGKHYNDKLYYLTSEAIDSIKKIISMDYNNLVKKVNCTDVSSLVIYTYDKKNRRIKISDWQYEQDILKILNDSNNRIPVDSHYNNKESECNIL